MYEVLEREGKWDVDTEFQLPDLHGIIADADVVHDTVDLMRHLRASGARRHVREEVPFFSGRRVDEAGVVEVLR